MARVITGTCSITAGGTIVTAWSGVVLSALNCVPESQVVIEGMANFVKERISTTSFEVELPHEGAGGTGLSTALSTQTPAEASISTLNSHTATLLQELSILDANGRGLWYNLIGVTGDNDPGPGNVAFNHDDFASITEIYIDVLDANNVGRNVSGIIELWSAGTVLIARSIATNAYASFQLLAGATDATGYYRLSVEPIVNDGALAAEPLSLEWNIVGTGITIDFAGTFASRSTYDSATTGTFYASVDGADGLGPPTVLYRKEAGVGAWSAAIPFQGPESEPRVAVTVWDPGRPAAAEVISKIVFDVAVSFPANFSATNMVSRARVDTPATASAVFSLRKNDVEFGTLTFAPAATVGVFASTLTSFAANDILTIVAPDPRDATLAQIAITLAGNR